MSSGDMNDPFTTHDTPVAKCAAGKRQAPAAGALPSGVAAMPSAVVRKWHPASPGCRRSRGPDGWRRRGESPEWRARQASAATPGKAAVVDDALVEVRRDTAGDPSFVDQYRSPEDG